MTMLHLRNVSHLRNIYALQTIRLRMMISIRIQVVGDMQPSVASKQQGGWGHGLAGHDYDAPTKTFLFFLNSAKLLFATSDQMRW